MLCLPEGRTPPPPCGWWAVVSAGEQTLLCLCGAAPPLSRPPLLSGTFLSRRLVVM